MRLWVCGWLVGVAVGGFGQEPSFEKTLSAPYVGQPEISPDGKRVAYTVTAADWKANTYRSQLWVYDLSSRERVQMTRGGGILSFHWAPESRRIAFTASRDGAAQIYLLDTAGGEAAKLTDIKDGIENFEWSPDGKRIAYTTTPGDPAIDTRKQTLGSFTVVEADEAKTRLGILNVPANLPDEPVVGKLVTEKEPFSVLAMQWSPDSAKLVLQTQPANSLRHVLEVSLYALNPAASDSSPDRLVKLAGPGSVGDAIWSPDSKSLAYTDHGRLDEAFYANPTLYTVPATGGAPSRVSMIFDEEFSLEKWTTDGILFSALAKTAGKLYRVNPTTGSEIELTPKDGSRDSWSFAKDGTMCAYRDHSSGGWSQIAVASTEAISDREVTQSTSAELGKMPVRELVHWKSKDDATIEGVLIKPVDFDPKKKYPLLVVIHGGPTGVSTPYAGRPYAYPIEQWVNRGAIVLQPNYRGSAGYGGSFRALNVRNLGVGDECDILSGVDFLAKQGFVDESRMGCMGWSQGGYISAFITTTSDRFKAISVGAGISDWSTYYYLTDITDFTRQYLKADPWTDPEIYRKTSPITYVKNAKTPTLIQQGSNDARVPVPNGYELYRALQDLHVPSKFILYSGFGHGITKPREQLALLQHNWEWFGKYLGL